MQESAVQFVHRRFFFNDLVEAFIADPNLFVIKAKPRDDAKLVAGLLAKGVAAVTAVVGSESQRK